MKVDLILLTNTKAVNLQWPHGKVTCVTPFVKNLQKAIDDINEDGSDWTLIWDEMFGIPPDEIIKRLITRQVDIWHSGLKAGVSELPAFMNTVDPTWMYNKNASIDVEHTNFRVSFRCLLIKTELLKSIPIIIDGFKSIEIAGVAAGYALIKSGAIIRYTPELLEEILPVNKSLLYDEWVFARKFYSSKWHGWLLIARKSLLHNLSLYFNTANIVPLSIQPCIHKSDVPPQAKYQTVSVLAPTLDRYEYLLAELQQLSEQTILPLEVLITDQTPGERRQRINTEEFPRLEIRIFPQQELGQCIAWNKLLEEARGEYVLFLGDDADNITTDFIERLLSTMQVYNADMVASNVIEAGIKAKYKPPYLSIADTFPITLIKRKLLLQTGFMDMFYNRNIRADHDLAMRCHLHGALMLYNPAATIYHHRAPMGGLRSHKARVVTNYMVKHSLSKFTVPTSSELYLIKKFYNAEQFRAFVRIKFLNQLFIEGGITRKFFKTLYFILKGPGLRKKYKKNLAIANIAINENTAGNRQA